MLGTIAKIPWTTARDPSSAYRACRNCGTQTYAFKTRPFAKALGAARMVDGTPILIDDENGMPMRGIEAYRFLQASWMANARTLRSRPERRRRSRRKRRRRRRRMQAVPTRQPSSKRGRHVCSAAAAAATRAASRYGFRGTDELW